MLALNKKNTSHIHLHLSEYRYTPLSHLMTDELTSSEVENGRFPIPVAYQ